MSGYNYNSYDGDGIPDMGNNGLPLVLADANIPTQAAVSVAPALNGHGTELNYSAFGVESNLKTPATTLPQTQQSHAKTPALKDKVASAQAFSPTSKPAKPPLWKTVYNAVIGGNIKTGTSYAAVGVGTTGAAGSGAAGSGTGGQSFAGNGVGGSAGATTGNAGVTRSNSA